MKDIASVERMTPRQDQRISEMVERERFRSRMRERCGFDPAARETRL